jgi:hypothetical protein
MDPRYKKVSLPGEEFIEKAVFWQLFLMEQTEKDKEIRAGYNLL